MAGIYIHIPFCKQACHYCDFHFSTSLRFKDDLIKGITKEIQLRKDYLGKEKISTIYFGGGTPSLLEKEEFETIFKSINKHFDTSLVDEITVECNPDDLTAEKLEVLRSIGVNRLSIGIQSFIEKDLQLMNRAHNAIEATESVLRAQEFGFDNITIDLIYGIPGLSNEEWEDNLQKAIDLDVHHISSYCLTVEKKTALEALIKKGEIPEPNEELATKQFEILVDTLDKNGFVHYEISNFAKEGFYSKHNSSYWKSEKYLGLGPSAHSFDGKSRQWNIANNKRYIDTLEKDEIPAEIEVISKNTAYNEYILTSLRTIWGVDTQKILTQFGEDLHQHFLQSLDAIETKDWLVRNENHIRLTSKGKLYADKIASDLFYI